MAKRDLVVPVFSLPQARALLAAATQGVPILNQNAAFSATNAMNVLRKEIAVIETHKARRAGHDRAIITTDEGGG